MSEPQMICVTDAVFVRDVAARLGRGSPIAPEELKILERMLDRLELASLDAVGFPEEWVCE